MKIYLCLIFFVRISCRTHITCEEEFHVWTSDSNGYLQTYRPPVSNTMYLHQTKKFIGPKLWNIPLRNSVHTLKPLCNTEYVLYLSNLNLFLPNL